MVALLAHAVGVVLLILVLAEELSASAVALAYHLKVLLGIRLVVIITLLIRHVRCTLDLLLLWLAKRD